MSGSDAVQLFVERATMTRSVFTLSKDNAAAVAAICRRLDGLPLAIELAAARTKLLSPHALLTRLDRALDLAATGTQGPERQRTLRSTIDWSYTLLSEPLQTMFRRMAVFSGGGDLAAVEAVARADETLAQEDVLDLVAGLVDASLVTIVEGTDGEPRIGMLQMMRAYALGRLEAAGEERLVRKAHAEHYMVIAERLSATIRGPQHRESRARFGIELDNFHEVLDWATGPTDPSNPDPLRARVGLRLCAALDSYWAAVGSIPEAVRWATRAISCAAEDRSVDMARCLSLLGRFQRMSGNLDEARAASMASVELWRALGSAPVGLSRALEVLGLIEGERDETQTAEALFTESLTLARETGDLTQICSTLVDYAFLMGESLGDYERALDMETEALAVAEELGDPAFIMRCQGNAACSMRLLGRVEEARDLMRSLMVTAFELDLPVQDAELAEDYAAVLAELGEAARAVWLFGAADAHRERLSNPRSSLQAGELADALRLTHEQLMEDDWDKAYADGRAVTVQEAFTRMKGDELREP